MIRRRRTSLLEGLTPEQRAFFATGEHPQGGGFAFHLWVYDGGAAATWTMIRHDFLAEWILQHPGTRPAAWWTFTGPQESIACHHAGVDDRAARRLRIGGIGTPSYEVLNVAPAFRVGLPTEWITAFDEAFYNGRALDVHGVPIGTAYRDGHFRGLAPRADDPPTFESQARFLDRHNLLREDERRVLPAEAFKPEPIEVLPDLIDPKAEYPALRGPIFDDTRDDEPITQSQKVH